MKRNPDVPLKTAQKFKDAGFTVEAYIIAAPKAVSYTHLLKITGKLKI